MGWFSLLICVIPIFLLYGTGHLVLWTIGIINAVLNFWSFGIMHNYALEATRKKYEGFEIILKRKDVWITKLKNEYIKSCIDLTHIGSIRKPYLIG